jgi:hypothetical protein
VYCPNDHVLVDWSRWAEEDEVSPGPWPCIVDAVHHDGTFDCTWLGQDGTCSQNIPLACIVERNAVVQSYAGFGSKAEPPQLSRMGMGATRRAREKQDREVGLFVFVRISLFPFSMAEITALEIAAAAHSTD